MPAAGHSYAKRQPRLLIGRGKAGDARVICSINPSASGGNLGGPWTTPSACELRYTPTFTSTEVDWTDPRASGAGERRFEGVQPAPRDMAPRRSTAGRPSSDGCAAARQGLGQDVTFDYHWLCRWHFFLQRPESEFRAAFAAAGIPSEAISAERDETGVLLFFTVRR